MGRVSEGFGRRRFLKGAAVLGAAGATGALPAVASAGDRLPEAERVTFSVPGLDPAHDGLRVAQLSDLHVGPRAVPGAARAAIEQANAFEPDLVVLTGDYLSHRRSDVADVREHLGGLRGPVLAVLGNHDVWLDPAGAAAALRGHGYEVLENAWTSLRLRGAPVVLDGITLPAERFPRLSEKMFRERDSTIYQLYQERYGINVVRSAERLSAALADRPSAKLLGVAAGAPLLRIRRTALTYHNVPVELRTSLVNTAEHEYFSDLGKN